MPENISELQEALGLEYELASFVDKADSAHGGAQAMFFKSDSFDEPYGSHDTIYTGAGRNASRWTLTSRHTGDDLIIYGAHLRAFPEGSQERLAGVNALKDDISRMPKGTRTIVTGDFNFYSENEPGYRGLIDMGLKDTSKDTLPEDPLFDPALAKPTLQERADRLRQAKKPIEQQVSDYSAMQNIMP